ncbi:serine/threonine protein kinase HT1, putative [Entamoeba invadens IP1]|uniref:Serine/threonine protein kinase HT1, putative n=1 Tax=Entamoeba invadens IP1 TaxID=370355 RepID=A0A0A1UAZ6_ENTIV|nr:serine/threonine protein kinase HT1, putative [Entamoeba invadens IP1]ELP92332.1 serine/threonine protein kinase HT1, putative [Entamoeba invadens IP1]|eukprot:XP_004259103.1 serine/threonine protein kinase HT1, putative [Entamoeba invadens IP1]
MKVQITTKENCEKYSIRTEPKLVNLKSGFASEFEIFITPHCTLNLNDNIVIITLKLNSGEVCTNNFKFMCATENSTKLDYDELIEEKKLGEGSFGVVFKGTFRGNSVAIKKMKNSNDDKDKCDEFEKEVSMLDKFRNEYIIHFYGAVFITNHICMVSEFAEYGSLQDLMKHKKSDEVDMKLRVKMLLDAAKGISYLHENGILHRDIKPDNILVFSLDLNQKVNAKLTDFGSARNVNLLMTNMTFTKGIGTPVYMAPEVLKQKKYTKSADVFSLSITMYETISWEKAYPQDEFKFPWKIAEFISSGKRLKKIDCIPLYLFDIISSCWQQDTTSRTKIEVVVEMLQKYLDDN